ncbi:endoglucanase [Pseudooceanicola antarcticus]|uniref:cellulase n=1 Tax=Pseudooceanicola antarcticus TaxID=1247613 RepID=A0A285J108_9RHOB|nr:glycosyl hydrolase family 8 [Pseudooceanicola antarcticus]PJE29888.1 glycosyl hydrolase family 5 [Pseudooceanicola antarcticus]SNY53995.1 endoglucanase [Pseudooceanicola antarcticus]
MRRRTFLSAIAAAPALPRGASARTVAEAAWTSWRARFLSPEGRVIDDGNGGVSHSEGQGYGLLLAQAFGDREGFLRIEGWTRSALSRPGDALLSWRWDPAADPPVSDPATATDGDLLRAWAHLRAALQSGWSSDPRIAPAITRDLTALCLARDPRAPAEPLLLPAAGAPADPARLTLNPSYFLGRAMRQLGGAFEAPALIRAADHGEALLAELAAGGPLPDWLDLTAQGPVPPRAHEDRSSYDALRIPLYLVWSGRAAHPAVATMAESLREGALPGHVVVARTADGRPEAQSDAPGFRAIATLAEGGRPELSVDQIRSQPYYPAVLQLLAWVAYREAAN